MKRLELHNMSNYELDAYKFRLSMEIKNTSVQIDRLIKERDEIYDELLRINSEKSRR